jgi:cytochrome c553
LCGTHSASADPAWPPPAARPTIPRSVSVRQSWAIIILISASSACSAAESLSAAQIEALTASAKTAFDGTVKPLLATYCGKCHGPEKHKGDVDFSHYPSGSAALAARALWRTTAKELRTREMPPEKESKQPSDAEREQIAAWILSLRKLDPPDPGRVTIRRLNRAEYNNTIRDLIGGDWKPAGDFPSDDVGDGFDNIGDVLSISPLLMEKYLLAADSILDRVVVDDQVNLRWSGGELAAIIDGKPVEGKPPSADPKQPNQRTLSSPGEVFTGLPVPKEGKYTVKIRAGAEQAGTEPVRLALKIDGQLVSELKVLASTKSPTVYTASAQLGLGQKRLSVIFLNPFSEPADAPATTTPAKSGSAANPAATAAAAKPSAGGKGRTRSVLFDSIEVVGPPAAPATDLHRRIFTAVPGKDLGKREAARKIAEAFATRAFRHPPSAEQLALFDKVFALGDAQDEVFSESVKLMIKAVLVSSDFLFRREADQPGDANGVYAVNDWELASRLSYFLWSSMPDEALFELCRSGKLHDPVQLEAQVRRMIKDPKSHGLVDNFAGQWLLLRNIFVVTPDEKKFPDFTKELRAAMYDEAGMMFESVLREDRSLLEFIDCDYTFVNAALAKLYGISGISGPQLRKVQLTDTNRGGILTMAGLLTVTSNPTRTSPVKRGKWIMEEILGTPPPPPPPMVEGLDKQDTPENAHLTLRQKMEKHRTDPACAACHTTMDQLGFGLEGFDAIGRWRDADEAGNPLDASGELPGGGKFRSVGELKKLLLAHKDDFTRVFATKLLTYALGRKLADADDQALDTIVAAVAKDSYKFDTLVVEIAKSFPFCYRRNAR